MDWRTEREAEQIARAREGSEDAFVEILRAHQGRVRAYLGRYVRDPNVIDDLAQETFLSAYQTLQTYRGEAPLRMWLLGIARHRALEHLRAHSRRKAHESRRMEAAVAEWSAERIEGSDPAVAGEEANALERCLESLPEKTRSVIDAFYFHAQSAVAIAKQLGRKESAVRMTLLRARQSLSRCVEARLSGQGA